MSNIIQIRNAPDNLHSKLKVRPALEGMAQHDHLLVEIQNSAERFILREFQKKGHNRFRRTPGINPKETVRGGV